MIALAMREFVNARTQDESQVQPFLEKIGRSWGRFGSCEISFNSTELISANVLVSFAGGYATLFGLVVAISDSLHLQLVRRVLARLFDSTPAGRARLCSPEVVQYLLAGLHSQQLKHVRLLSLQQTHLFIQDKQGQERLVSGQSELKADCISGLR
jgi:hypothetical protein